MGHTSKKLPSPFKHNGELHEQAFRNLLVALLLRSGGTVVLTYEELQATNKRQFMYEPTDIGMRVSLVEQKEGQG